jgi:hypothetical protein
MKKKNNMKSKNLQNYNQISNDVPISKYVTCSSQSSASLLSMSICRQNADISHMPKTPH